MKKSFEQYWRDRDFKKNNPYYSYHSLKLAIKKDGKVIKNVPTQTEELCCLAVKQDAYNLSLIKMKNRTKKVCLIAIKQNWKVVYRIQEYLYNDQEVAITTLEHNWSLHIYYLFKEINFTGTYKKRFNKLKLLKGEMTTNEMVYTGKTMSIPSSMGKTINITMRVLKSRSQKSIKVVVSP